MNRLIAAILIKAVDDWDNPQFQPDIVEFLDSEWFNQLTEILDMEPETVRNRLITGDYKHLSLRAIHR